MLDALNAVICLVLMCLLAPVSIAMRSDGHWPERLAFVSVCVMLGLQVLGPMFNDWIPEANGLQLAFNFVLLLVIISARHEIMAVVKLTVGRAPQDTGERRRAQDLPPEFMAHVHGRGKN